MKSEAERAAAVAAALPLIDEGMVIGLGSGRALFALVEAIGKRWQSPAEGGLQARANSVSDQAGQASESGLSEKTGEANRTNDQAEQKSESESAPPSGIVPIKAVVASSQTAKVATEAGIPLLNINDVDHIDIAFDGADEIDPQLGLIKGGGAALLREKIVISLAQYVVIMAQESKFAPRLGTNWKLPVEIVQFGSSSTVKRLERLTTNVTLRRDSNDDGNSLLITDEGHYIADIDLPKNNTDLEAFGLAVKTTLGVVEHGLFLKEADKVILGKPDGTTTILQRAIDVPVHINT